jgi:hypothetical protein
VKLFNRNTIKLDCYTYDKKIIDLQPLQTRRNNPPWWTSLKSMYKVFQPRTGINVPTPTIKACPGIVDYIRRPILIKMWSDIIFRVLPDGRVLLSEPLHSVRQGVAHVHDREQHGDAIYKNRTVVKLMCPWHVVADQPIEVLCADPHYISDDLREHGIEVSPGILSLYDQHTLNVFLTFPIKEKEYEVTIKYDTPLMGLFPMTEKKIEIEMHHTNRQSWENICDMFPSTFIGRYHARKRALKN